MPWSAPSPLGTWDRRRWRCREPWTSLRSFMMLEREKTLTVFLISFLQSFRSAIYWYRSSFFESVYFWGKNLGSEPEFVNLFGAQDSISSLADRNDNPIWRTCPQGNLGWRNRYLGIDSWSPKTFTNSGSGSQRPVPTPDPLWFRCIILVVVKIPI